MAILSTTLVRPQSEALCLKWKGELKGEICIYVNIEDGAIKLCIRGKANRLGEFNECYNLTESCYTVLDYNIAKLKICLSEIVWQDGFPNCFRIKVILDPALGGNVTLVDEKVCALAVLGSNIGAKPFKLNSNVASNEFVILLVNDNQKQI